MQTVVLVSFKMVGTHLSFRSPQTHVTRHVLTPKDFPSTGRFRILLLTSTDLLSPTGVSASAITTIASTLLGGQFPSSVLELVAVHPKLSGRFDWKDVPSGLKQHAEMRFYDGSALQDAYETYGVSVDQGAIAVVRPDGYVGTLAALGDVERVTMYLKKCLRSL